MAAHVDGRRRLAASTGSLEQEAAGPDHREEIDELIERHHASQDEALAAWERRRALDAV